MSIWWLLPDSNWGHKALQASALPTELKSRIGDDSVIISYHHLCGNKPAMPQLPAGVHRDTRHASLPDCP